MAIVKFSKIKLEERKGEKKKKRKTQLTTERIAYIPLPLYELVSNFFFSEQLYYPT